MWLIILKHRPEEHDCIKVMEEQLFCLEGQEHDWTMAMQPYFINNDAIYFTCFNNDFEKSKITFEVKKFDFKIKTDTKKAEIKYTRVESMDDHKGKKIYCT